MPDPLRLFGGAKRLLKAIGGLKMSNEVPDKTSKRVTPTEAQAAALMGEAYAQVNRYFAGTNCHYKLTWGKAQNTKDKSLVMLLTLEVPIKDDQANASKKL